MPVNWAFPAAQGEPESFLAVQGSICSVAQLFSLQSVQSIICSTCSTKFSYCTHKSSPLHRAALRPLTTSVGGVLPMKSFFYAGLVLALAFSTITAIAEGGSIHGTVTDPLGAVVPDAQVELLRQGKQVSVTTTDSEGKYRFLPLTPGRYQVRATRAILCYATERCHLCWQQ